MLSTGLRAQRNFGFLDPDPLHLNLRLKRTISRRYCAPHSFRSPLAASLDVACVWAVLSLSKMGLR